MAAAGRADFGDRSKVAHLSADLIARTQARIMEMLEDCVERSRLSPEPLPVIVVGGGSILVDGPIGDELLNKLSNSPQSRLIGLCWMDAGARSVYNSKKPVKSIDDLKGLKIRMMGNPIFVDTMNALGGNGIAMGFDQLYNALQTGVVDGAENNPPRCSPATTTPRVPSTTARRTT